MARKRIKLNLLIAAGVFLLLVFVLIPVGGNMLLRINDGPTRTYSLPGNSVITDEQAITFAKQTLAADGRSIEGMVIETSSRDGEVSRGDDKTFVSVSFVKPNTYHRWHVSLHRLPDKVEAVSTPGK